MELELKVEVVEVVEVVEGSLRGLSSHWKSSGTPLSLKLSVRMSVL